MENNLLEWFTIFDLGNIYNKIIIEDSYYDNKNLLILKNKKEFKIYTSFFEPIKDEISSIELKQVIDIINKNILLPLSSASFNTVDRSLQFYPLIKPLPKLTINTKLNNGKSNILQFNNFSIIDIQEYKNNDFDDIIKNDGIILTINPIRITDNEGEIIDFEIIPQTNSINYDLYYTPYDVSNNNLL